LPLDAERAHVEAVFGKGVLTVRTPRSHAAAPQGRDLEGVGNGRAGSADVASADLVSAADPAGIA
jgi:hypothetical protein